MALAGRQSRSCELYGRHYPLLLALVVVPHLCAAGQIALDQVNVSPLSHLVPPSSSTNIIRSNVDLVLVNVTVLDHLDRAVAGLQLGDFRVQDNNRTTVLRYVANMDEPASLVVVFDASGSMGNKMGPARDAVNELINTSNPQDQVALVVVTTTPYVALHFDRTKENLAAALEHIQPHGSTALWDGLYLGVQELRLAEHQRKAIVVISDGGDNHSRRTQSELKPVLEEANGQMYAIGLFDSAVHSFAERLSPSLLDELASSTGGRLFSMHDVRGLPQAMTQISRELRNQYILGYYPASEDRDGKWHRIRVHLSGQAARAKYRLYWKKGYYATLRQ